MSTLPIRYIYLENTQGRHNKFYAMILFEDDRLIAHYGGIGTKGTIIELTDPSITQRAYQKIKKGYQVVEQTIITGNLISYCKERGLCFDLMNSPKLLDIKGLVLQYRKGTPAVPNRHTVSYQSLPDLIKGSQYTLEKLWDNVNSHIPAGLLFEFSSDLLSFSITHLDSGESVVFTLKHLSVASLCSEVSSRARKLKHTIEERLRILDRLLKYSQLQDWVSDDADDAEGLLL